MTTGVALVLVAVLIGLNGLFVAAEFSFVASRRGLVEERARAGDRRARIVLRELRNLSFVLSAAQFGITASSLIVGFLAEPALGPLVEPLLERAGLPDASATAVAVTVAFLVSTVVQMVFGELAPKNVAIARPESVALRVGVPMWAFGRLLGPVVRVFDRAAAWVSGRLLGVEMTTELMAGHTLGELSRIISASGAEGALTEEQAELLGRAVELGDRRVSAVMVPRPDVVWLRAGDDLETLRETARATGFSRFPVAGASEDEIVGTVHLKDVLAVAVDDRGTTTVAEIADPPMLVPESESLRRLLTRFRVSRRTFAVVVDEYGGTAGIVTVEDLVEELVGEIEDEFDRHERDVRRLGEGRHAVAGSLRIDELEEALGLVLPEGDYETVAGFVIAALGRIPAEGDETAFAGWRLIVTRMDGVRVAELRVEAPDDEPAGSS